MNFSFRSHAALIGVALLFVFNRSLHAFTVTTTADTGNGSLRQGISATPAGGSIDFNIPTSDPGYDPASTVFTIVLTSAELQIARDVTINGPTNAKLVISGNNARRVFNVLTGNV